MRLLDTFQSPSAKVSKAILVVDLVESTKLKTDTVRAQWIPTYGWFYDTVSDVVINFKGEIIKFLGDGVLAVFTVDDVASALNAAIAIQESFADANERGDVNCKCAVGIAVGEVVEFEVRAGSGVLDYLGPTVDRAFRLCSEANAKAIFVDSETVAAAAMLRIKSRVGEVTTPKRKAADYQGNEEVIQLKGFPGLTRYHEIWWSQDHYGVRPEALSKKELDRIESQDKDAQQRTGRVESQDKDAQQRTDSPKSSQSRPEGSGTDGASGKSAVEWHTGSIDRIGESFGIIRGQGETFVLYPDGMFGSGVQPQLGQKLLFKATDALPGRPSRRATSVFVVGQRLRARVSRLGSAGYGFAELAGRSGYHTLFVPGLSNLGLHMGDEIECSIGESTRGPIGLEVSTIATDQGSIQDIIK